MILGNELIKDVLPEKDLYVYDILFRAGMYWKIVYSILRFILVLGLVQVIGLTPSDAFYRLMQHEILERRSDALLHIFMPLLHHMSFHVTYFIAFYIFFWAVIDTFLAINLLRHKMWAFPFAIVLISIFVAYEIFRVLHTHSITLWVIIFLNTAVVWLVYKEYNKLKAHFK